MTKQRAELIQTVKHMGMQREETLMMMQFIDTPQMEKELL